MGHINSGNNPVHSSYRQLRTRRALMLLNDVPWLRTRRVLSPKTLYSNSALLVLCRTSLNINNALLALNRRYFTSGLIINVSCNILPLNWMSLDNIHIHKFVKCFAIFYSSFSVHFHEFLIATLPLAKETNTNHQTRKHTYTCTRLSP